MKQSREGLLLVVSGPAGVGKGSIDGILLGRHRNMRLSVSATTRSPRPGEIDGVHYFFIDEERFRQMIAENAFLEYMQVFNMHYYGTPRAYVEQELRAGHDVLLEIDVQGAMRVKESYPDAVLIFVAPPSMSALKERLIGRNTETPEQIEKRFATAYQEVRCMNRYDYIVVNDVLDVAVRRMEHIINAEKCRASRNQAIINEFAGGKDEI